VKQWIIDWVMNNLDKLVTDDILNDLKEKFVGWLRAQAALSETEIDDAIVDIVARTLGVK
jgi:hypothetical protein